jgi:hypothetical protein
MVNANQPTKRSCYIGIQYFAIQDWKKSGQILLNKIKRIMCPRCDVAPGSMAPLPSLRRIVEPDHWTKVLQHQGIMMDIPAAGKIMYQGWAQFNLAPTYHQLNESMELHEIETAIRMDTEGIEGEIDKESIYHCPLKDSMNTSKPSASNGTK